MTHLTPNLKLTAYNTSLDALGYMSSYINSVSGSDTNQNLLIIDNFSASTSASLTMLSGSITNLRADVSASYAGTSASLTDLYLKVGASQKKNIWIGGWQPCLTDASGSVGQVEMPTSKNVYDCVNFVYTGLGKAYANVPMPLRFGSKTSASCVAARFYWMSQSQASGSVLWGINGVAIGNGQSLDVNETAGWGNAYVLSGGSPVPSGTIYANTEIISGSADLWISGSPQAGDMVRFKAFRYGGNDLDTFDGTALLLGVMLEYESD